MDNDDDTGASVWERPPTKLSSRFYEPGRQDSPERQSALYKLRGDCSGKSLCFVFLSFVYHFYYYYYFPIVGGF